MGNKGASAAQLHDEARLAASRFDEDELELLRRTWLDLAERSTDPQKGVTKETFLQYMPLHGLLGERLFNVFDHNSDGFIDFDEFVTGLSEMGRGNMDQKIRSVPVEFIHATSFPKLYVFLRLSHSHPPLVPTPADSFLRCATWITPRRLPRTS